MNQIHDINGDKINIGDIIGYVRGNGLVKAYLLGFTKRGFYVSIEKDRYYSSNLDCHNDKKYTQYLSCILIERNTIIPEILIPHCKMAQIPK